MTTNKTTRTRAEAKQLMWEFYSENKSQLPKWIRTRRDSILEALQIIECPVRAFEKVIDSVDDDTVIRGAKQ